MFCPHCRAEYRDGFTECADCGVPLVTELPPEPDETLEYVDLKSVLVTGDVSTIAIARSILQEDGIPYRLKNDGLQDLLGAGRIGSGFNIITGPVELLVAGEDRVRALELLEDLQNGS